MDSVKNNRDKYVGGSDLGAILGVNQYCSRLKLLKQKSLLVGSSSSNDYIDYGNFMESHIRDWFNTTYGGRFTPQVITDDDRGIRCNVDGYSIERNEILEIKTASNPTEALNNKSYLAQLLLYVMTFKADRGILCVYDSENFDVDFNEDRVTYRYYDKYELLDELKLTSQDEVYQEIEKFWNDLEKFKANENIVEEELIQLARKLNEIKLQQEELQEEKEKLQLELIELMKDRDIKEFEDVDGIKVSYVKGGISKRKVLKDNISIPDEWYEYKDSNRKDFIRLTIVE